MDDKPSVKFWISSLFLTENPNGVPEFWLTIFKNVDMLSDMVQEHDEAILKHLQNIKVTFSQSNPMVREASVEHHLEHYGNSPPVFCSVCPSLRLSKQFQEIYR